MAEYQFRIVDSRGKPVVGAKVTPVSVSAGAGSMSVSDAICTATISDQEGNAHLKFKIDLAAKAVRIPLFEIQEFLILGEPSPPGLNLKIEHPDHPVWNGYVYPNGDKPIVLADSSSVSIRGHRANSDVPLERLYPVLKGRANWSQERGILTLRNLNLSGDGGERWLQVVHVPEEGSALYGDLIDLAALKDKLSEPLVVELKSGVRVTGSVDSKIPRPIRNGIVLGQITNHRGAAGFNQMSIKQAIESDGTFVIDSLPRGTDLQVVALCEGWVSRTPPVAELKEYGERYGFANSNFDERNNSHLIGPFIRLEGESISPVIAMIPTTTCEVTVLDRDEAPLPGVAIIVSPGQLWHDMGSNMLWMGGDSLESIRAKLEDPAREISPASFNGPTSYRGETDSQGRVTISGLPSQIDPNGRKVQFAFMGSKEGYRFSNGLLYGPIQSMEIRRGEQGKITLHMERDPEYRASVGESKPAEEKPNPAPVPEVKDEKSDVGGDGKVGVAAAGLTAETVVARVGDTEIRAREVLEAIAPQLKQLRLSVERLRKSSSESQYTDLLKQVRQIQEDQIKKRLPDMVEIRLLSLAMTDHLKTLNQSQVLEFNKSSDEFLNNSLNRIQSTLTLASRDEVESRLIKEGYDFHVLCEQQREAFLANAFHSQRYLRLNEPTAEKIRAYYDSNLSRYTQAERIVWEAIQFVSERDGNPELPQDLVRQIRSDFEKGRPVDEIVKKHPALIQSISKEDDKKTDLESFSDPNLTRILTVLPIGGVSELRPILGDLQFVRVVNRLPAYVTPFEQCKGEIAELLKKQEAEIEYDKLIEELRGKYPVWTIVNGHPHRKRIESWSWAGMPPPGPVIVWLFSEGDTGLYRSARSRELR